MLGLCCNGMNHLFFNTGKMRKAGDSVGDQKNEIIRAIKFHGNDARTYKINHCLLAIQELIDTLPKMKQQELRLKLHQLAFEFLHTWPYRTWPCQ